MRGVRSVTSFALAILIVALPACDGDGSGDEAAPSETGSVASPTGADGASPSPEVGVGEVPPPSQDLEASDFDPIYFDDPGSATVDNGWLPLVPGTQLVFKGSTVEDDEREFHRLVVTVTDLTKAVEGVRTRVVWDQDFSGGELVESEIAFLAQDRGGHVWRLGEYPEEYEEGEFVKAPAWIAGTKDSQAGIAMLAEPETRTESYAQGLAPSVKWDDRAQVYRTGQETCVPAGCYEDVLVMEEFEPSVPGAFQLKYYAPGVGNVRVGWRGEVTDRETLKLVKIVQLDTDALEAARARALELEARAYEIKTGIYGQTDPAQVG